MSALTDGLMTAATSVLPNAFTVLGGVAVSLARAEGMGDDKVAKVQDIVTRLASVEQAVAGIIVDVKALEA